MRALFLAAALLLTIAPSAAADHPCPEVAPGVYGCDNNWDGEVDQYAVEAGAEGASAGADVAYVDFAGVKILLVGADANAQTPAGAVDAFAYSYCIDLDDDATTCEYTTTLGYASLDSEAADAQLLLIHIDWDETDLGQHTLFVDAAGTTSSALVYHYCREDASADGCSMQMAAFSTDVAGTTYGPWGFVSRDEQATGACVIAYVGACQAVPVGV